MRRLSIARSRCAKLASPIRSQCSPSPRLNWTHQRSLVAGIALASTLLLGSLVGPATAGPCVQPASPNPIIDSQAAPITCTNTDPRVGTGVDAIISRPPAPPPTSSSCLIAVRLPPQGRPMASQRRRRAATAVAASGARPVLLLAVRAGLAQLAPASMERQDFPLRVMAQRAWSATAAWAATSRSSTKGLSPPQALEVAGFSRRPQPETALAG